MRGIQFFLVRERLSAAMHACDKEESDNDTIVWGETHRSSTGGGIHDGPFAVAGFVRRGEEMRKRRNEDESEQMGHEMGIFSDDEGLITMIAAVSINRTLWAP